jgi:hypothetical protein
MSICKSSAIELEIPIKMPRKPYHLPPAALGECKIMRTEHGSVDFFFRDEMGASPKSIGLRQMRTRRYEERQQQRILINFHRPIRLEVMNEKTETTEQNEQFMGEGKQRVPEIMMENYYLPFPSTPIVSLCGRGRP